MASKKFVAVAHRPNPVDPRRPMRTVYVTDAAGGGFTYTATRTEAATFKTQVEATKVLKSVARAKGLEARGLQPA